MPEYLAPGVFIEEVSFRAKTIEGVSTSTAGFIGPARYGPITGVPDVLTSFADFERVYGGLDQLRYDEEQGATHNFLAHAVRAFFDNGGSRVYISRVYRKGAGADYAQLDLPQAIGSLPSVPAPPAGTVTLKARYPGAGGNLRYVFTLRVGSNTLVAVPDPSNPALRAPALRGVSPFDLVYVKSTSSLITTTKTVFWADRSVNPVTNQTTWTFRAGNDTIQLADLTVGTDSVFVLTCDVSVTYPGREQRTDVWTGLAFHPDHLTSMSKTFAPDLSSRLKMLTYPLVFTTTPATLGGPSIAQILFGTIDPANDNGRQAPYALTNATDGTFPKPGDYEGDDSNPKAKNGLKVFEDIADISIVAAPGSSVRRADPQWMPETITIAGSVITHCEKMKYRIGVIDPPNDLSTSEVKDYRAQFDTTYAALYYPWVRIFDPVTEDEINLAPSGFVSGIYARNDIEKGVHKAPANEVVRDAISFEVLINKAQQEVLNPLGINCFRWLDNLGYRLWGARLMSSDGEWRYVNLRRYFAYLERSIEMGTQWAVFENNGDALWANVRRTIEDFLFNEWKSSRLFGEKSEDAFFVRCDRTTMTQNDIDSGRLICLIGVAPLRPAEFVIFRIGQWVAPARG
jgi:uncharacterized protein